MMYSIFFKDVTSTGDTIISGAITFDCIKSFSESRSATVTTHTVEQGFNISDNMNLEPVQFHLDGYVTSYSLLNDREITWDGEKFKTDSGGNKNRKRSPREITLGGDTFKTVAAGTVQSVDRSDQIADARDGVGAAIHAVQHNLQEK